MYKRQVYTGWRKRTFKHFEAFINYPISIIGSQYISIGKGSIIQAWKKFNKQTCNPSIVIGNNVTIGQYTHITAINTIKIDDGVLTGRRVLISDNSHGSLEDSTQNIPPINRPLISKGGIHICKNVWIGNNVVILSGVTIGEGAIIGANAVVTKDIKPYTVVAGVPAKVISNN